MHDIIQQLEKKRAQARQGGRNQVGVIVLGRMVVSNGHVEVVRLIRPISMTPDKFEHILALQMDDGEKRARADHVIDTGKDINETRADVRALVKKLRLGLA